MLTEAAAGQSCPGIYGDQPVVGCAEEYTGFAFASFGSITVNPTGDATTFPQSAHIVTRIKFPAFPAGDGVEGDQAPIDRTNHEVPLDQARLILHGDKTFHFTLRVAHNAYFLGLR
jgi:hypothetical protein